MYKSGPLGERSLRESEQCCGLSRRKALRAAMRGRESTRPEKREASHSAPPPLLPLSPLSALATRLLNDEHGLTPESGLPESHVPFASGERDSGRWKRAR
ncbi:hypothetical protein AAFF_G00133680 [Aldrovandia affinis]|uniref:Uncharacterized protein n=1 Tax=Aldrovandia affinis TaxID=143900 RepID=A0AAD7RQU4_9TELE|nr:hypothetical protein AAFF_G00133680 [Aldrovandia affinis]